MALSPISPESFRPERITAPAAARLAGSMQAAEALRQDAPAPEDGLFLTGPLLMEEPVPAETPAFAPRESPAPPEVLLEEMQAAVPSAPEILESGTKLTYDQHLQLMAEAASRGSESVALVTAAGVPRQVQVHGASPQEKALVEAALRDLAGEDRFDLLLRHVKNVYVTDTLSSAGDGKAVAGVALKESSGETSVILSRMKGQASRNKLERPTHVKHVLYHEIGHVVDNRYNLSGLAHDTFGQGEKGSVGLSGDFVSHYAATSTREDYAESFAEFFTGRTSGSVRGCTDEELIQVLSFGGSGRIAGKLQKVAQDLGPDLHCKEYFTSYMEEHRNEGTGPRQVVRRFYDEPEFRRSWVEATLAAYPAVPREAVYGYMESVARLFDEPARPT